MSEQTCAEVQGDLDHPDRLSPEEIKDTLTTLQHKIDSLAADNARLRSDNERLRFFFDNIKDAYFEVRLDGTVIEVSPSITELSGFCREDVIGSLIQDFYTRVEQRERLLEELRSNGSVTDYEVTLRNSDGREVPCSITARLICDDNGVPMKTCGTMRDISRRKNTEQALRDSKEQFRLLSQASFEAVAFHDQGVLEFANEQFFRLFGYTPEELIGKDMLPLTIAPDSLEIVTNRIASHTLGRYEVVGRRKDGSTFPIEILPRQTDYFGRPIRVGVIRDLSEQKQAEEHRLKLEKQILQAQKLESLGVLAGGVAHDFNNLLMGIMGNIDLALMKLAPLSPVRANIEEMERSARKAAELAEQMLAYSGKGKFAITRTDLSQVLKETTQLVAASISKKIELRYHLSPSLPQVNADTNQIRQVLLSLVTNAAEAIGEGTGSISISTSTEELTSTALEELVAPCELASGPCVCLEVTDNGCGMEQSTLDRIFEPFFTTKFTGRGLGLAALLGIVQAHQAGVSVKSVAGKGTRFRIFFPLADTGVEQSGFSPATACPRLKGTVLLIDDDDSVRQVAGDMLELLGYGVLAADDPLTGLTLYQTHTAQIVLVILDSAMPSMSGEEVIPQLRRINPEVKVILASGYSEEQATARVSKSSLAAFIHKPYKLSTLERKINQALEH